MTNVEAKHFAGGRRRGSVAKPDIDLAEDPVSAPIIHMVAHSYPWLQFHEILSCPLWVPVMRVRNLHA